MSPSGMVERNFFLANREARKIWKSRDLRPFAIIDP